MKTISEIAVMQAKMEDIQTRTYVSPSEYGSDTITDKHKRLFMYDLQCTVVILAMQVLGHMMEDHPDDLDET